MTNLSVRKRLGWLTVFLFLVSASLCAGLLMVVLQPHGSKTDRSEQKLLFTSLQNTLIAVVNTQDESLIESTLSSLSQLPQISGLSLSSRNIQFQVGQPVSGEPVQLIVKSNEQIEFVLLVYLANAEGLVESHNWLAAFLVFLIAFAAAASGLYLGIEQWLISPLDRLSGRFSFADIDREIESDDEDVAEVAEVYRNLNRRSRIIAAKEGQLEAANLRGQSYFQHSPSALMRADSDNIVVQANRQLLAYLDFSDSEVEGVSLGQLLKFKSPDYDLLRLNDGQKVFAHALRRNGDAVPVLVTQLTLPTKIFPVGQKYLCLEDQRLLMDLRKKLIRLAYLDDRTGLKNLRALIRDFEQIEPNSRIGVGLIRVGAKLPTWISRSFLAGNVGEIHQNAARVVNDFALLRGLQVYSVDDLTFEVLAKDNFDIVQLHRLAEELCYLMSESRLIPSYQAKLDAFAGVARYDALGMSGEEFRRRVSMALEYGLERGRSAVTLFTEMMLEEDDKKLLVEKTLNSLMEAQSYHLVLHQVNHANNAKRFAYRAEIEFELEGRYPVKQETLRRLASSSGLDVVLQRKLVQQLRQNSAAFLAEMDCCRTLLLPLSAAALVDVNVLSHLETLAIENDALKVLILIGHQDFADLQAHHSDELDELRRVGYRIVIDQVGECGQLLSSLASTRYDYIRLSERMLAGSTGAGVEQNLLKGMVQMLSALGKPIFFSGVNNARQVAELQAVGVDYLDGNYFGSGFKSASLKLKTHPAKIESIPIWY
ncbi:MAG: EAL domain-containing protein [Gammaproteobacteria bacterium]|nr:EAL domain-containing protein [Gammaproteobacteria bacterium]